MLVSPTVGLHVLDVDVGGLHQVPQVGLGLHHLGVVPEEGHEDVPVLRVVEDVPLHHLGTVPHCTFPGGKHLLYAQEELLVGLNGIVEPGEEEDEGVWLLTITASVMLVHVHVRTFVCNLV